MLRDNLCWYNNNKKSQSMRLNETKTLATSRLCLLSKVGSVSLIPVSICADEDVEEEPGSSGLNMKIIIAVVCGVVAALVTVVMWCKGSELSKDKRYHYAYTWTLYIQYHIITCVCYHILCIQYLKYVCVCVHCIYNIWSYMTCALSYTVWLCALLFSVSAMLPLLPPVLQLLKKKLENSSPVLKPQAVRKHGRFLTFRSQGCQVLTITITFWLFGVVFSNSVFL